MTVSNVCDPRVENCSSTPFNKPSLLASISNALKHGILALRKDYQLRVQRRIDRDAFKNLLLLDADQLRDIGVNRDDVIWAANLPLHASASKELEKVRAQNVATTGGYVSKRPMRGKW